MSDTPDPVEAEIVEASDEVEAEQFGDADPEDRYDAGDPLEERLAVLVATLASIGYDESERRAVRLAWALAAAKRLLGAVRDAERDVVFLVDRLEDL
jgi:hypothetical protein